MSFIINTNFSVNSPYPIDIRLIVDRVDGVTASLVSLDTGYNYTNMYVWVREEKAFYYLIDTPDDPLAPGATISDWFLFSGGGGATGCAKSGYVPGTSFTGNPATASVVFGTPYQSASYSVVVTGEAFDSIDYAYSVIDKTSSGFIIRVDTSGPITATAMWITNCWDGSGLSSGGAAGAQGAGQGQESRSQCGCHFRSAAILLRRTPDGLLHCLVRGRARPGRNRQPGLGACSRPAHRATQVGFHRYAGRGGGEKYVKVCGNANAWHPQDARRFFHSLRMLLSYVHEHREHGGK